MVGNSVFCRLNSSCILPNMPDESELGVIILSVVFLQHISSSRSSFYRTNWNQICNFVIKDNGYVWANVDRILTNSTKEGTATVNCFPFDVVVFTTVARSWHLTVNSFIVGCHVAINQPMNGRTVAGTRYPYDRFRRHILTVLFFDKCSTCVQ